MRNTTEAPVQRPGPISYTVNQDVCPSEFSKTKPPGNLVELGLKVKGK
jgi:hypothetical protein